MTQVFEDVTITIAKVVKEPCPCYVNHVVTGEPTLYKTFYLDTTVYETIKGATMYIAK